MRNKKTKKDKRRKKQQELALDFNKPSIISGNSPLLRDMSPGHMELWFFGWTPGHYRDNFVLNPLPVLVFVPLIVHHLQQVESSLINPHPIVVDLRPEQEVMFIKQRKRNKFIQRFPFISKNDFGKLAEIALKNAPDNYTREIYKNHIKSSFQSAQQHFKNQQKTTHAQRSYQKKRGQKKPHTVVQNSKH